MRKLLSVFDYFVWLTTKLAQIAVIAGIVVPIAAIIYFFISAMLPAMGIG